MLMGDGSRLQAKGWGTWDRSSSREFYEDDLGGDTMAGSKVAGLRLARLLVRE